MVSLQIPGIRKAQHTPSDLVQDNMHSALRPLSHGSGLWLKWGIELPYQHPEKKTKSTAPTGPHDSLLDIHPKPLISG